jgi:hypothetical protein
MAGVKMEWIWAIVSLTIAIVLAYVLVNIAEGAVKSQVNACVSDDAEAELIRTIVLEGINTGLQKQVIILFEVWMKDHNIEQPKRAVNGTNIAVNAFIRARANIYRWEPTICTTAPKLQSDKTRPVPFLKAP